MAGSLFDPHSDLFRTAFSQAVSYQEHISTGSSAHQERWAVAYANVELDPSQIALLSSFKRVLNILVLSGTWCGDCARQCPIIQRIAEAAPASMTVRFIDNERIPELRDEFRIHGAARVPVVVTLSEDFLEINRFGDRMLSVYRRKAQTELGAACDIGSTGPKSESALELCEWIEHFERLHLLLRVSPFLRKRHND